MEHFTAAFEGPELHPIVEFQVCNIGTTLVLLVPDINLLYCRLILAS